MDDGSELERRLDALYVAVRDSATVDRQAAFDIAMNELEYRPLHAEARELAEASVADDDETRLASAAAAFLDAYGYEPGTWAGDQGWTAGIFPSEAADDLSALVAVAEQARQAIMESLQYQSTGRVWPACPAHGLGTSPEARHGTGLWWCDGGDGHVAAEIGHWAASQPSRYRTEPGSLSRGG